MHPEMPLREPVDKNSVILSMKRLVVLLIIAVAAVAAMAIGPVRAAASCAVPPTLADALANAQTVFIGTAIGLSNGARNATVHVDDVWKGAGVSAIVQVIGTPDPDLNAVTSVDRSYTVGQQYLFFPASGSGDRFQDNSCTLTQPYAPSLVALRPASAPGAPNEAATSPSVAMHNSESSTRGQFPTLILALIGVAVLLLAGGLGFAAGWRRTGHANTKVEAG